MRAFYGCIRSAQARGSLDGSGRQDSPFAWSNSPRRRNWENCVVALLAARQSWPRHFGMETRTWAFWSSRRGRGANLFHRGTLSFLNRSPNNPLSRSTTPSFIPWRTKRSDLIMISRLRGIFSVSCFHRKRRPLTDFKLAALMRLPARSAAITSITFRSMRNGLVWPSPMCQAKASPHRSSWRSAAASYARRRLATRLQPMFCER